MGEFEIDDDEAMKSSINCKTQRFELDCDEGACAGARQSHLKCVETYCVGEGLAIQVVFPKRMHMTHVERTLVTRCSQSSDDPQNQTGLKAYDLVSIISRVGGAHYVCYRLKNKG